MASYHERIGHSTSTQAEYRALIKGMVLSTKYSSGYIVCFSDSELIVNQMNREWKVKDEKLKLLWAQVVEIEKKFESVRYIYLPRTDPRIVAVNALANKALDEHPDPS